MLVFGYVKAKASGTGQKDALLGAVQTLLLGSVAAGVVYGITRALKDAEGL